MSKLAKQLNLPKSSSMLICLTNIKNNLTRPLSKLFKRKFVCRVWSAVLFQLLKTILLVSVLAVNSLTLEVYMSSYISFLFPSMFSLYFTVSFFCILQQVLLIFQNKFFHFTVGFATLYFPLSFLCISQYVFSVLHSMFSLYFT